MALKNDGSVVVWGGKNYPPLIAPLLRKVPLGAQSGVVAITAGWFHVVALNGDGSVLAWGSNEEQETTVPAAAQSGVVAISTGFEHTVALKADGSVVAWGHNFDGETNVPAVARSGVVAISAGGFHNVALLGKAGPLQTNRNGNQVILSWPTNLIGYTLQSAPSLLPPVDWSDFNGSPAVV